MIHVESFKIRTDQSDLVVWIEVVHVSQVLMTDVSDLVVWLEAV